MSDADLLRHLADPATVAALTAGAAAMDDRTRLLATISGLEMTNSTLTTDLAVARRRIAELEQARPDPLTYPVKPGDTLWSISRATGVSVADLKAWNGLTSDVIRPDMVLRLTAPETEPAPTGRFPGDPGPGRILVGCATTNMDLARLTSHEKAAGVPCAFREYENDPGMADFAVPNGRLATRVKRDHAAGRIPVISAKPGVAALAAHQYRAELVAFFRWLESLGKLTVVIVHHEPENDGLPPAQFREAQRWIRECMTEAEGGDPEHVMFLGSLMTYTWTPEGTAKHGHPDTYNPGKLADGRHVWDACGLDHYTPNPADPILSKKWGDAVASLKTWGVLPAVTELGVRPEDPKGGAKITAAFEESIRLGMPLWLYYDSHGGPSTGTGWDLGEQNGTLPAFRAMLADPRTVHPNRP